MKPVDARIGLFIAVALILTIIPLPDALVMFRPPWVLLLLLMVQFYLPHRFSALLVVLSGLLLDALLSTIIGEHVFALSFACLVASQKARRFYCFGMSQQMAMVGMLCVLYQLAALVTAAFLGEQVYFLPVWGSTVSAVLLWPWCKLLVSAYFEGSFAES